MRAWFAQKSERETISFSYARVGHTFSREEFYVAKEARAEQTQWSLLTLLLKQRLNQVTFQLRQVEQVIEETRLSVSYAVGDRGAASRPLVWRKRVSPLWETRTYPRPGSKGRRLPGTWERLFCTG